MTRLLNLVLVVVFAGILVTPPIGSIVGVDGADPDAENRTLAALPTPPVNWRAARNFLPGLDRWFTDHFAFRSTMVRAFAVTRYFWLGVSPSPDVAVSRDGWLFYIGDGGLEDFTNVSPLTEPELATWRRAVWLARQWCEARGIMYGFTIAPDKGSIYPEVFPQTARPVSPMSRTDQILSAISDTGAGIDLRPELRERKRQVRVFQKTDTHWNARGAHAAYTTVIDALRIRVPAIPPPLPLSAFDAVTTRTAGMDLAAMIGLKRVLGEENLGLVPREPYHYIVREPEGASAAASAGRVVTEIPGSSLPRAVIFRDSFMSAVAPFLSEHFSRAVYIWRNDFSAADVEEEHPDVVLHEIVGRHVQYYVPSPELIPEAAPGR